MSVESLFDQYYERATIPLRNTEFYREQRGEFDIRSVVEDDEFRQLNHLIVLKDGAASSVWRQQEWGLGDSSVDVTHFVDGTVKSISLRYRDDSILGMKVSLTRNDWLIADPDHRLPYIFGRSDMETWYKVSDFQMNLIRARLAWDKETKHTFTVKDRGIDKKSAAHLYKDVEYRIQIDDAVRLQIEEKTQRDVSWKTTIGTADVLALYDYATDTRKWIEGWEPVAEIVEL